MPDDPEHPSDKPLRTWASQRRDQAKPDFTLHPANRRLLQDEVRRRYGGTGPRSRPWLHQLILFWPRWALALGIFVLLGAVIWQMDWAPSRPMEMAQSAGDAQEAKSASEPASSSSEELTFNDTPSAEAEPLSFSPPSQPALEEARRFRSQPAQQNSAEPLSVGRSTVESLAKETSTADEDSEAENAVLSRRKILSDAGNQDLKLGLDRYAAELPTDTKKVESVEKSLSLAEGIDADRQESYFAVAPTQTLFLAADLNSSAENTGGVRPRQTVSPEAARGVISAETDSLSRGLLRRFELQQSAETVRIIDGDGSVYAGSVVTSNALPGLGGARSGVSPEPDTRLAFEAIHDSVTAATGEDGGSGMQFLVTGTNRTTGERVEFFGQLQTNQARLPSAEALAPEPATPRRLEDAVGPASPVVTLEGSLRVGRGAPVPLRANQIERE